MLPAVYGVSGSNPPGDILGLLEKLTVTVTVTVTWFRICLNTP
jgi:hypothetical protein